MSKRGRTKNTRRSSRTSKTTKGSRKPANSGLPKSTVNLNRRKNLRKIRLALLSPSRSRRKKLTTLLAASLDSRVESARPKVSGAARASLTAKTLHDRQESSLHKAREVVTCKRRPTQNTGSGNSRPFIPWCKGT